MTRSQKIKFLWRKLNPHARVLLVLLAIAIYVALCIATNGWVFFITVGIALVVWIYFLIYILVEDW